MGLGVDAARDRQPGQLQLGVVVVARLRVAPGAGDAALHGADAGIEVQLGGQRLGRKLDLLQLGVEGARVQENGVAADGLDDGHVPLG